MTTLAARGPKLLPLVLVLLLSQTAASQTASGIVERSFEGTTEEGLLFEGELRGRLIYIGDLYFQIELTNLEMVGMELPGFVDSSCLRGYYCSYGELRQRLGDQMPPRQIGEGKFALIIPTVDFAYGRCNRTSFDVEMSNVSVGIASGEPLRAGVAILFNEYTSNLQRYGSPISDEHEESLRTCLREHEGVTPRIIGHPLLTDTYFPVPGRLESYEEYIAGMLDIDIEEAKAEGERQERRDAVSDALHDLAGRANRVGSADEASALLRELDALSVESEAHRARAQEIADQLIEMRDGFAQTELDRVAREAEAERERERLGLDIEDPYQRRIHASAQHEAEIRKARAAEARGDTQAALAAWREADRWRSTAETRRKVTTLTAQHAAGELAGAVAELFIGDPEAELREWVEEGNRLRAQREATIEAHFDEWVERRRELIDYNIRALQFLTDRSFEGLTYDDLQNQWSRARLADLRTDDIEAAPSNVVAATRADSVYVFALVVEERNYSSNVQFGFQKIGLGRQLANTMPDQPLNLHRIMPMPRITVRHAPLLAFAAADLRAASAERDLNEHLRDVLEPFGYQPPPESVEPEHVPLLIASDSRGAAEALRQQLVVTQGETLIARADDYRIDLRDNRAPGMLPALLVAGGHLERGAGEWGTALRGAADRGDTAMVRALLDAGADVEASTQYGGTALIQAAWEGHVEAARLLLQAGADVNLDGHADMYDGPYTPLGAARERGHEDVAALLVEHGGTTELGRRRALATVPSETHSVPVEQLLDGFSPGIRGLAGSLRGSSVVVHETYGGNRAPKDDDHGSATYTYDEGRLWIDYPDTCCSWAREEWDLGEAADAVMVRVDVRNESDEYDSWAMIGFDQEDGHRFQVRLNLSGGTGDAENGSCLLFFAHSEADAEELCEVSRQLFTKQAVVEVMFLKDLIHIYVDGQYHRGISMSEMDIDRVWVGPTLGSHYSFNDVTVVRLPASAVRGRNRGYRVTAGITRASEVISGDGADSYLSDYTPGFGLYASLSHPLFRLTPSVDLDWAINLMHLTNSIDAGERGSYQMSMNYAGLEVVARYASPFDLIVKGGLYVDYGLGGTVVAPEGESSPYFENVRRWHKGYEVGLAYPLPMGEHLLEINLDRRKSLDDLSTEDVEDVRFDLSTVRFGLTYIF